MCTYLCTYFVCVTVCVYAHMLTRERETIKTIVGRGERSSY